MKLFMKPWLTYYSVYKVKMKDPVLFFNELWKEKNYK